MLLFKNDNVFKDIEEVFEIPFIIFIKKDKNVVNQNHDFLFKR